MVKQRQYFTICVLNMYGWVLIIHTYRVVVRGIFLHIFNTHAYKNLLSEKNKHESLVVAARARLCSLQCLTTFYRPEWLWIRKQIELNDYFIERELSEHTSNCQRRRRRLQHKIRNVAGVKWGILREEKKGYYYTKYFIIFIYSNFIHFSAVFFLLLLKLFGIYLRTGPLFFIAHSHFCSQRLCLLMSFVR